MNLRALITILLGGRVLFEKSGTRTGNQFLSTPTIILFLVYLLYISLITASYQLFTMELLKQLISTALAAYFAFYYLLTFEGHRFLKTAVIFSGLLCLADLVYTYKVFGSFPVQRLYIYYTGGEADVAIDDFNGTFNHNFFGQVCGMAFIFIFVELFRSWKSNRKFLLLLPMMFMGILMSTSRSALVALVGVIVLILFREMRNQTNRKIIGKLFTYVVGALFLAIVAFQFLSGFFKLDTNFLNNVVFRLVDEPLAILQKSLGQPYDIQSLGPMYWREEASANALQAYANLDLNEQLFGIGSGGFIMRDLGHGLNPHNGVLMILIESGLVGFCLYLAIIGGTLIRAIKLKSVTPSFAVICFIAIYGIGQNAELTSSTMFLFVATVVAENVYASRQQASSVMVAVQGNGKEKEKGTTGLKRRHSFR
jgi:O-antigen ligase